MNDYKNYNILISFIGVLLLSIEAIGIEREGRWEKWMKSKSATLHIFIKIIFLLIRNPWQWNKFMPLRGINSFGKFFAVIIVISFISFINFHFYLTQNFNVTYLLITMIICYILVYYLWKIKEILTFSGYYELKCIFKDIYIIDLKIRDKIIIIYWTTKETIKCIILIMIQYTFLILMGITLLGILIFSFPLTYFVLICFLIYPFSKLLYSLFIWKEKYKLGNVFIILGTIITLSGIILSFILT
jgi:hypothetical protein